MNPLLWLHLKLSGAWRTNASIVLVFAAIVITTASISYRMAAPGESGNVSAMMLGMLTAAQAAFVVLVSGAAIRRSVLRDFQTGMIESHRLSPMSGLRIVMGYLLGAPVQAMLLYLTTLVLGAYFAADYARSLGVPGAAAGWYFLQICLLILGFFLCALTLLLALASAGKANVLGLMVVAGIFGGWMIVAIVPGLALLAGAMSLEVLAGMAIKGAGAGGSPLVLPIAAVVQTVLGLTFVAAACRKVRAPERAMFSIPLGLLLLAACGATLVIGQWVVPGYRWIYDRYNNLSAAQVVASTAAFMVVAQLVVIGAAAELFAARRSAAFGVALRSAWARSALLIPPLLGVATTGVAVLLYLAVSPERLTDGLIQGFASVPLRVALAAALVLSFWSDFCCAYAAVARGLRIGRLALLWFIGLKGLPLAADLVVNFIRLRLAGEDDFTFSPVSGASPIGTLIHCIIPDGRPWEGLGVQVLIAAGLTLLAVRAERGVLTPPSRTPAPAAG